MKLKKEKSGIQCGEGSITATLALIMILTNLTYCTESRSTTTVAATENVTTSENRFKTTTSSDTKNMPTTLAANDDVDTKENRVETTTSSDTDLPAYSEQNILTFSSVSFTTINVTWPAWNPTVDIGDGPLLEYILYMQTGVEPSRNISVGNSTLHHMVEYLDSGTTYYFRLAVVSPNGEGVKSEQQSVTTCRDPTNIEATSSGPGSLNITWNEIPPLTQQNECIPDTYRVTYKLLRHLACEGNVQNTKTEVRYVTWNISDIDISGLEDYAEYVINVTALVDGGSSPNFESETATAHAYTVVVAPRAVRGLTVTPSGRGSLQISWDAPDASNNECSIDRYRVIYRLLRHIACGPNEVTTNSTELTVETRNTIINYLEDYAEYQITVIAEIVEESSSVLSGEEESVAGTTAAAAPDGRVSVKLTRKNSTSLKFSWNKINCIHHNGENFRYFLKLRKGEGTSFPDIIRRQQVSRTSHQFINLNPCGEYQLEVIAKNDIAVIADPTISESTTTNSAAPSAVSGLTATPSGRGSLIISWDAPDTSTNDCSIDRYRVTYRLIRHIACGPEEETNNKTELTVETRRTTINNMEDYAEYQITVIAQTDVESSSVLISDATSAIGTTAAAAPDGLISFQQVQKFKTSLRFSWSEVQCKNRNGANFKYSLQLLLKREEEEEETFFPVESRPNVQRTVYLFSQLRPCGEYKLQVMAINSETTVGVPATSEPIAIDPTAPSAVSGLTATPSGRGSLRISWDAPDTSTNECSIDRYRVTYSLIRHIACGPEEETTNKTEITVETRRTTINNLEDYAEYQITVIAETDVESSSVLSSNATSAEGTTSEAAPGGGVLFQRIRKFKTSLRFSWREIQCTDRNGANFKYSLQLLLKGEDETFSSVVSRRNIYQTNYQFYDLRPCGEYKLQVMAINSGTTVGITATSQPTTINPTAPSAVSGLTATPSGRGSLRISWDAPDTSTNECSIDRYRVTYNLIRHIACGPEEETNNKTEVTVETRRTTINNLEDYAEYQITVIAETDVESSSVLSSNATSAEGTTSEAAPGGLVSAIQLVRVNQTSLGFSWSEIQCTHRNGENLRYSLQLLKKEGATFVIDSRTDVNGTAHQFHNLRPCGEYKLNITAKNDLGTVRESTTSQTTETHPAAPNAVRNLRTTAPRPGYLRIEWDAPDTYTNECSIDRYKVGYTLIRRLACGSDVGTPQTETLPNVSRTVTVLKGLENYARYLITVIAEVGEFGSALRSEVSSENGATIQAEPSGPPRSVTLRKFNSTSMRFSWSRPSCVSRNGPIIGYTVDLNGHLTDTEEDAINFEKLTPYTNYSFQVRAYNNEGNGPYSASITALTEEDVPPMPEAPKSNFTNTSAIQITWSQPDPPHGVILGYNISYSKENDTPDFIDVPINGTTPLVDIITNLQANANYSIRISARTRIGQGKWSAPLYEDTDEDVPSEPQGIEITYKTRHVLRVVWNEPRNPNGDIKVYTIRYRAISRPYEMGFTSEKYQKVIQNGTYNRSCTLDSLDPSTEYEIQVSASTAVGEGQAATKKVATEIFSDLQTVSEEDMTKLESSIQRGETNAIILLPGLDQKYATGYFIKVKLVSTSKRSVNSELQDYDSNPNDYIAAEIPKSNDDRTFTIGDGRDYNGFYNAPLEKDEEYEMLIGVGSKIGEQVAVEWSSEVKITPYRSGSAVWIILILLLIFAVISIVVAGVFVYKKRRETQKKEEQEAYAEAAASNERRPRPDIVVLQSGSPEELELQKTNNKRGRKPPVPEKPKSPGKTVKISDLAGYIKKKKASENDNFFMEYETLSDAVLYPWDVAEKSENKRKNRYGNIIPYNSSRVILEPLPNDPHSDYINASYIDGYKYPTKYIASHGPNTASVKDFWRMVWQENVGKIVMLTNLVEMGKKKCEKYWPDHALKYNHVIVTLQDEKTWPAYTVRTFILQSVNGEEPKSVIHYHFTAWPDMKVPDFAGPILELLQRVRLDASPQTGPMVVHCSAGVGRTGTYIALDAMLDMADAEGKINVFDFVSQMRENRIKMVQMAEQYQFIFDALLEHFIIGCTSIPTANLRTVLNSLKEINIETGRTYLQDQFETLELISVTPPEAKYKGGKSRENRNKNRFPDRLPVDTYRPYLMTDVGNQGTNYINASFLSGYKKKDMFIGTQTPLETTVLDFWRMIWDYNSHVIVMLNDIHDKSMVMYWDETDTYKCGPFSIDLLSSEDMKGVRYRQFELSNSSQSYEAPRRIMHLQCLDWTNNEVAPKTPEVMPHAINMLNQWEPETDIGPITVHCIDGVGRTGVFCALVSALDQAKAEDAVDIFQLVNKMRTSRPSMVETNEQYQCIFETLLSQLEDFEIYENFSR